MADVAEKIERLPEYLKLKAEGYVDALVDVAEASRHTFLEEFERAERASVEGRTISDEEFKTRLEAKFGPLKV